MVYFKRSYTYLNSWKLQICLSIYDVLVDTMCWRINAVTLTLLIVNNLGWDLLMNPFSFFDYKTDNMKQIVKYRIFSGPYKSSLSAQISEIMDQWKLGAWDVLTFGKSYQQNLDEFFLDIDGQICVKERIRKRDRERKKERKY